MKIASLLPSATEIVYFLGLGDALVGVTDECDHPPEARSKPVVSRSALGLPAGAGAAEVDAAVAGRVRAGLPLYEVDSERLRSEQPDLILAQDLCRVCAVPSGDVDAALRRLGCSSKVVSLDPHDVTGVLACIERVAELTGASPAPVEGLRRRIAAVRAAVTGARRPGVVALEWAEPPFVGGHWVPEMVAIAGGRDLLGAAGAPSRRVAWEELAAADPEVVVFMPCGYGLDEAAAQAGELVATRPELEGARLVAVDASAHFSRPGPRIVDGIEVLAGILHPDRVPPPGPDRARVVRA